MRRDEDSNFVSSARSVYVNFGPASQKFDDIESHMLLEDIHNQVVPYRLDDSSAIALLVTPAEKWAERIVAEAIEVGSWRAVEAAERFLRQCCSDLLLHPMVPYEIERFTTAESEQPLKVTLRPIQPWTVREGDDGLLQHVPADERSFRGLLGENVEEVTFLPDRDLVRFRLPDNLRRDIDASLERLHRIPSTSFPPWFAEELVSAGPRAPMATRIDTGELRRRRLVGIAAATARLGWDGRWALQEVVNEYYLLVRQIQWQRFLCRLRGAVIETLNESLRTVLVPWGVGARLSTKGLPTLADLERLEVALVDGRITLGEAYSQMSLWRFGRDVNASDTVMQKSDELSADHDGTEPDVEPHALGV